MLTKYSCALLHFSASFALRRESWGELKPTGCSGIDISCFYDWFFKTSYAISHQLSLCRGELGSYMFQMTAEIYKEFGPWVTPQKRVPSASCLTKKRPWYKQKISFCCQESLRFPWLLLLNICYALLWPMVQGTISASNVSVFTFLADHSKSIVCDDVTCSENIL